MGDTMVPGGAGSVRGESAGTQLRTYGRAGTVGGIFKGFQVTFALDGGGNTRGYADTFELYSNIEGSGEEEILAQIAALLTRTPYDPSKTDPMLSIDGFEIELSDEQCHWFHRVRTANQHDDKTVHISHPDDPHSLLILENTDEGLLIVPQGRWQQEIGLQIGKLAAQWALANMPPEALNPSPHGKTLGYYPRQRPNENIS